MCILSVPAVHIVFIDVLLWCSACSSSPGSGSRCPTLRASLFISQWCSLSLHLCPIDPNPEEDTFSSLCLKKRGNADNCYLTQCQSTSSIPTAMYLHQLSFILKQGRLHVTFDRHHIVAKICWWHLELESCTMYICICSVEKLLQKRVCYISMWKMHVFAFLVKHKSDPTNRGWLWCRTNFAWFSPTLRREMCFRRD